ncbi:MAG: sulfatase [Planctomycetota bacterium]|jgi:arylsulfatase A-like enzyme
MQKTRRDFLKKAGIGAMGLSGLMPATKTISARKVKAKPNIILVLTDDQGWTDTSVQMMAGRADSKSDYYQTPALERLAREGMIFSSAYSPAPVCTPTRVSIQFGKTPARLHDTGHYRSARKDFDAEVSVAQAIKAADPSYAAAHFGKWGGQATSPEQAGYDRSDGKTNNYHGDWRSLKDRRPIPLDNPKQIFSLTRRACEFMEDQVKAGRPFYLQVSHYAVHSQHRALKETIEKYRKLPRGEKCDPEDYESPPPGVNRWMLEYAAMIENLDAGLEGMLKKIDELGIADNTYVIFFSDNGGDFRGNAPLRGQKSELWEGGIRVPMVVRGPGIKPGSRCDEPVVGWDFLPTFVDLAGGGRKNLSENHDGGSLRSLLENSGKGEVDRPVKGLVFHFPDFQGVSMSAIRLGDYKILKDWETGRIHLYNLADDLSETRGLAAKMPGKANELHRELMNYLDSVNAEKAEDIHLDSLKQATEQKRKLEIEIRELLDTEDQEGKERWSQLNMRLGFQKNRIQQLSERLRLINEANQRETRQ